MPRYSSSSEEISTMSNNTSENLNTSEDDYNHGDNARDNYNMIRDNRNTIDQGRIHKNINQNESIYRDGFFYADNLNPLYNDNFYMNNQSVNDQPFNNQSFNDQPYMNDSYQENNFILQNPAIIEDFDQKSNKKIKLEYIKRKPKRGVTFSKRKKGIMKKAFELSILTGSEILLVIANETGHVYTYATPKLKPVLQRQEAFIKACLGSENANRDESE